MSQVKTNGYLLDNLPEGHSLLEDFRFFDQQYGGSKPLEIYLQAGSKDLTLFDYKVLKEIDKLEDFVRGNFGSGFIMSPLTAVKAVNKAKNQGNPKAFVLPSPLAYERMQPMVNRIGDSQNIKLWTADKMEGRLSTKMADGGSLLGKKQHQKLEEFVANKIDASLLEVRLTGTSFLIDKSHELVTYKVFSGLGFAFLLVGIIIGFLFRSWMQMRKQQGLLKALYLTYLTTGKAIILTTLILVSGFVMLTFSSLEIPWFTGVLVSLSLLFAVLADLLWLPVLLLPFKEVIKEKINRRLSPDQDKQTLQK